MDREFQDKFNEARQLAKRGEGYEQEGNYDYAAKCFFKVSKILSQLQKNTKNQKSIKDLHSKIQKYINLAAKNQAKFKQKQETKVVISKLGFPDPKKKTQSSIIISNRVNDEKPQIMMTKIQTKNRQISRVQKVDSSLQGLVCKNLKHSFKDIIGMDETKQLLYQAVIFPQKRPDLFEGIRSPPRGILLYGPPGNGKTFIVKALAKQSGCIFYGCSAGSIVNKFVGQSEKMLKKIFQSAKKTKPSIIFIDQIDSIITARTQNQNDSSRRLKTQFLVQFDSLEPHGQVILVGATNFPGQLDMAALRRFNKLIYIGLPDKNARKGIIEKNLEQIKTQISKSEISKIVKQLQGYTASQITDIIKEVCMLPLRDINKDMMQSVSKSKIRPVNCEDFMKIIKQRKPLMTKQELKKYEGRFK